MLIYIGGAPRIAAATEAYIRNQLSRYRELDGVKFVRTGTARSFVQFWLIPLGAAELAFKRQK